MIVTMLFGCSGAPAETVSEPAPPKAGAMLIDEAVRSWKELPSDDRRDVVADQVAWAMEHEPDAATEIAAGDALANVLGRPEEGLVLLDRHELGGARLAGRRDALLRAGLTDRLGTELGVDGRHPAGFPVQQASVGAPEVRAADWEHAIRGAMRIDAGVGVMVQPCDVTIASSGALGEVAVMLWDGWTVDVAAGLVDAVDGVPRSLDGQWHVLGWETGEAARRPGVALDLAEPGERILVVGASEGARTELVVMRGQKSEQGGFGVVQASDCERVRILESAADDLGAQRIGGVNDKDAADAVRKRFSGEWFR